MATIQKRTRNGKVSYRVRYRDPEGRQRSRSFPTKALADRFAATNAADMVRGDWVDPGLAGRSFRSYGEAWLAVKRGEVKEETADGYAADLRRYVYPVLGQVPVGRIMPETIDKFLAGLPEQDVGPVKVRNLLIKVVRPVLNHAVRDGAIKANPSAPIKVRKPRRKRQIHTLTAAQVAALVDELAEPYATMVLFTAYTGLRWGEVTGLRLRRLDLMRGRVEVAEVLSHYKAEARFHEPKTAGSQRAVSLPRFLVERMREHVTERALGPDDLVFTTPRGKPLRSPNFLQTVYVPAVHRALPEELHGFRFHDLRHTTVALLIEQGAHPKEISTRLGHSSISVTMDTYGHLLPSLDARLIDGLDAAYEAASRPTADGTVVPLRRQ